jgi:hypothetical protein
MRIGLHLELSDCIKIIFYNSLTRFFDTAINSILVNAMIYAANNN